METAIKSASKTRTITPGRTRVTVSLTDEHHRKIEEYAKKDSVVFPRAVNEMLSILIEKNFAVLTGEPK